MMTDLIKDLDIKLDPGLMMLLQAGTQSPHLQNIFAEVELLTAAGHAMLGCLHWHLQMLRDLATSLGKASDKGV